MLILKRLFERRSVGLRPLRDASPRRHWFASRYPLLSVVPLAVAAACGGEGMATPMSDGGSQPVSAPDMAAPYLTGIPPKAPQLDPGSGTILAAPRIVPIFFRNDSYQTSLTAFIQSYVTTSSSWAVLQEYGVGRGTMTTPIVLGASPAAATSESDVVNTIQSGVQSGALPKNDANTLYVIYYPSGVTISGPDGTSCVDFAGYHQVLTLSDGTKAPYAVIPRCKGTNLALLTFTTSHELAEAATDPQLTAYNQLKDPYPLWSFALNGAEVGDLCENLSDSAYSEPGIGVVSRLWSNRAAALLKNPCLPVSGSNTDFFALPIFSELLPVNIGTRQHSVEAITIPAGQQASLPVHLYSVDTPSPTWSVRATETPLPSQSGGTVPPVLTLSWQESPTQPTVQGQNGAVFHLQLAVAATAPAGLTMFTLVSTGTGALKPQTNWVGTVHIVR